MDDERSSDAATSRGRAIEVRLDDLSSDESQALVAEHLAGM